MATILTCPHCGKLSKATTASPGSAVRCPYCTRVMRVPEVATAEAPAAEPPAASSPPLVSPPIPSEPTTDSTAPAVAPPQERPEQTENASGELTAEAPTEAPGIATMQGPQDETKPAARVESFFSSETEIEARICSACGTTVLVSGGGLGATPILCEACRKKAELPKAVFGDEADVAAPEPMAELASSLPEPLAAAAEVDDGLKPSPDFPLIPTLARLLAEPLEPEDDPQIAPPAVPISEKGKADGEPVSGEWSASSDVESEESAGQSESTDSLESLAARPSMPRSNRRRPPSTHRVALVAMIVSAVVGGALAMWVTMNILKARQQAAIARQQASTPRRMADDSDSSAGPGASGQDAMTRWEQRHSSQLFDLRNDALNTEARGDLAQAQRTYQQMARIADAAPGELSDPNLQAIVQEARQRLADLTALIGPPPPDSSDTAPPIALSNPRKSPPGPAIASKSPSQPKSSSDSVAHRENASTGAPASPPAEDWQKTHKAQILALAGEATAMEGKDPGGAILKLDQLLELTADHRSSLDDPQIKSALAAAASDYARLLPSARKNPETDAATARALLSMSLAAERDGKWVTALEASEDATQVMSSLLRPVQQYRDPRFLASLDATFVACIKLNKKLRIAQMFAIDEPLAVSCRPGNLPTRELVWNQAAWQLQSKGDLLRAIKVMRDYFDAHTDPDEQMLNLMGTLLYVADQSNPPNRTALDDAIGYYSQRNADLEKTRPGFRRWGVEWLPEDQAKEKFDDYAKKIDLYAKAKRLATAADAHLQDLQNAQNGNGIRPKDKDLAAAKTAAAAAATAVKAAHDAIPSATWLSNVVPLIPTVDFSAGPIPLAQPEADSGIDPTPATKAAGPPPFVPSIPESRFAVAFAVDGTHLLTAASALGSARTVRLTSVAGQSIPARVLAVENRLALLEVAAADVHGGLSPFPLAADFTGGAAQCPALVHPNIYIPEMTLLSSPDTPPPLRNSWFIRLSDQPRLPGSPMLDMGKQVIGMEIAGRDDDHQKIPAVSLDELRQFLQSHQIIPSASASAPDPSAIWQVTADAE